MRPRRVALAALGFALACGGTEAPQESGAAQPLGGRTVAVVGTVAIDAQLVSDVAARDAKTPREALDALVSDALAAQGARARGLDATPAARQARRAVLARLVADRLYADSFAKGPPTDAEVQKATDRHWREVDTPELAQAVHVVVMKDREPGKQARAREVAEALRRAVDGATSAQDFIARAKEVDPEGLVVRPESLPDFAADGRAMDGTSLDETFVKAAFALAPGETSGIVSTKFGLHVIRMLARVPAKRVPLEQRRARFHDEIMAERGRAAYDALLAQLKSAHPVQIDPAADTLLQEATTGAGKPEAR
ncbi:MAG TPA: peptidylprolyl isomerase [Polyangiaceae bacterium]|nr:peptidylprolyl isomerase [Polyangiaceae bacterium]